MQPGPWFRWTTVVLPGVAWLAAVLDGSPVPVAGAEPWRLASPADYQVFQRRTRTEGAVVLEGSRPEDVRSGDVWEVRMAGVAGREKWEPLSGIVATVSGFRAELAVPAGGWYDVGLRVRREASVLREARVEHVGVGEVFVVAGQSNSANHGEERGTVRTGRVSAMGDGGWQLANDPQPGASGGGGSFVPWLGDRLAERFQVPVGFIGTGVGATSVREWLPAGVRFPNPPTLVGNVVQVDGGGWKSRGNLFGNFVARMRKVGPRGFRAVLWHQGESDANQADPTRTLAGALYAEYLGRLIRDSRRELGWDAPWFVAQVSYHTPTDPGSPGIRRAQQEVISNTAGVQAGPDSDALGAEWRDGGGKGVHFSGKGLQALAAGWEEKVGPWLWAGLAGSVPAEAPVR